ncbi:hypothetical protein [Marinobacterium mangrovicola]|uniref:HMA domain-containing protein n=1 Tax=Marinobacterium mangrovicola TaxID=1476959 RepID=A0A4R1G815_9GAMM|nr:hypothetical protein [Marinobacterium mangrovicola]TCK02710.1 hypothetical protein CLV83_4407 [Marinobacterium mangrovicola]
MSNQVEPELNLEFILKRRLKLVKQAVDKELLQSRLEALVGMASVHWQGEQQLELRYDASQLQLDQVIEVLVQSGAGLEHGRLAQLRLGWYRMTDRNTWDSSRHVPHCCNKSPK